MYSLSSLVLAGTLALHTVLCLPDPSRVKERDAEILKRSVDSFIATESPIALSDLLCNIGANGACASGADSGIVVASPDKTNPDWRLPHTQSRQRVANHLQISTPGHVILLLPSNVSLIRSSAAIPHPCRPRLRITSMLKPTFRLFLTRAVDSRAVVLENQNSTSTSPPLRGVGEGLNVMALLSVLRLSSRTPSG